MASERQMLAALDEWEAAGRTAEQLGETLETARRRFSPLFSPPSVADNNRRIAIFAARSLMRRYAACSALLAAEIE